MNRPTVSLPAPGEGTQPYDLRRLLLDPLGLLRLIRDPLGLWCRLAEQHGDLLGLGGRRFFSTSPAVAVQILVTEAA
ncbi:MAG: hypothetical protein ACE5ID_05730, partial [Acidobacteriota bacterium]